jgi:hypothetical protein
MTMNNNPKDKKSMEDFLSFIISAFNKFGIIYWIDAGALLKAIRSGDILPSSDIDFGMWNEEIDKIILLCDYLRCHGFEIVYPRGYLPFESIVNVHIPDTFNVPFDHFDLMLYVKYNKEACIRGIDNPCKHSKFSILFYRILTVLSNNSHNNSNLIVRYYRSIPIWIRNTIFKFSYFIYLRTAETLWHVIPVIYFENLNKINQYGVEINIPSNVKAYLGYRYGNNWSVKDPKWRLSDGYFLRFRKPVLIPEELIKKRIVRSDYIKQPNNLSVHKGMYFFDQQEIYKITSVPRKS